ncbi:FUSC family protein [Janibacter limosus]|uniref:FUSC family protein n=1 Tax=Janibacter limosus TaxID=53458 RepID=UPI000835231A|nr:FUSC family protein [Janibacter limosus]
MVGRVEEYLRPLVRWNPGPDRRWIALRAAAAVALPLVGFTLAGHGQQGFLAGMGVFAVLYGAAAPVRRRFVVTPLAGLGLLASMTLGILLAGHPLLAVLGMALAATIAAVLSYALQVGPPGAFFFALVTGIANIAASHGADPMTILGFAAVGVLSAVLVGTSDVWFGGHGIEDAAVGHAEVVVEQYLSETRGAVPAARRAAAQALNTAWTAVTDGGSDRFDGRLQRVHSRYASAVSRAIGGPDEDITAELALHEAARVRQVSLGRPRPGWSLRQALRWPSEDLLVGVRVAAAAIIAGSVALLLDNAHAYWAAAFAVLIVHVGGTRSSQLHRAFQRTVGTALGLLAFTLLLRLDLSHWWTVAVVIGLQFVVEMLITRNYALAVVFLTPLALVISEAVTGMDTTMILLDRGIDTVIGVGAAVLVLVVSSRLGRPELLLRAHARRVVLALDDVLTDLAERRTRTDEGMAAHLEHCRQLYVELLASDQVARRALADAPEAVGPYRHMEELLASIGYLVLGATWNPRVRGQSELMGQAREALADLTQHPVTRRRPAEAITDDLRRVRAILTEA